MSKSGSKDALKEVEESELHELDRLLDNSSGLIKSDIMNVKSTRKLNTNHEHFKPSLKTANNNNVNAAPPAKKPTSTTSATTTATTAASPPPSSPRSGSRLDLSRKDGGVQAPKISDHREDFLAPGSIEYGLAGASGMRWLTPEDLEFEFGASQSKRMIDDYDLDSVNNSKKQLEAAAKATKPPTTSNSSSSLKSSSGNTALASSSSSIAPSSPPPIPNRSARSDKDKVPVAAATSPRKESPRAATSPRRETSVGNTTADRDTQMKEKLATLKTLFNEGLITKEEYDVRRNKIVDEMLMK